MHSIKSLSERPPRAQRPATGIAALAPAVSPFALMLASLSLLSVWPASARADAPIHHRTSDNWAGYADTASRPITAVSGSWVEPAPNCSQGAATYSAFWVGLGGFKRSSHELEQIGTEADCTANRHSRAFAWYEIVPAPSVQLRLAVHAGDRMSARVTVNGHIVQLRIENVTTHRNATRTVTLPSPDVTSADWIAEAPSACYSGSDCQVLPLSDFGSVAFAEATATPAGGQPQAITATAFTTTAVRLAAGGPPIDSAPTPGFGSPPTSPVPVAQRQATPSKLSAAGSAFTVTVTRPASPSAPG